MWVAYFSVKSVERDKSPKLKYPSTKKSSGPDWSPSRADVWYSWSTINMPPRKHLDDPKVIKSAHFWQPNAAEQGTGETTEVIFDPTDLWINDLNEKIVLSFTWQMSLDFIFLAGSGCLECIQGYEVLHFVWLHRGLHPKGVTSEDCPQWDSWLERK